jgi:hypothetical protein
MLRKLISCQFAIILNRMQKKPLVFVTIIFFALLGLAIYSLPSSISVKVFAMKKTTKIVCTLSGGPNPDKKYDCCYEEYDSNTGSTLGVYCADCWKNAEGSFACNDYVKVLPRKAGELLGSNVLKDLKEAPSLTVEGGDTNNTNNTINRIKNKLNLQELPPLTETNKAPPSTSDHPSDEKTGKSENKDLSSSSSSSSSSSDVSRDTPIKEGSKTDDSSNKHKNNDLKDGSSSSSDALKENASP